jgi:hypothetical protein
MLCGVHPGLPGFVVRNLMWAHNDLSVCFLASFDEIWSPTISGGYLDGPPLGAGSTSWRDHGVLMPVPVLPEPGRSGTGFARGTVRKVSPLRSDASFGQDDRFRLSPHADPTPLLSRSALQEVSVWAFALMCVIVIFVFFAVWNKVRTGSLFGWRVKGRRDS